MSTQSDGMNPTDTIGAEDVDQGARDDSLSGAGSGYQKDLDPTQDDGPELPITIYTPGSAARNPKQLLSGLLVDLGRGRELSWRLFVRNIRALYRQTLLGLFWAFLPPLAQTAIWVFLNATKVVTFETPVHYVAFVMTGMVLWQGFIDALQAPLAAVGRGKPMLAKINFPRESLLVVAVGEVLFNLAIRSLLLVAVCLLFRVPLSWGMLAAPVGCLALVMFGTGLGLLLMPIGTLYQDVGRLIGIAMPFWMLLTPIVYPTPETWPAKIVVVANPVSPLLIATRDLMLMGHTDQLIPALIVVAVAIPILLVGILLYRLSMPILIERMNA